MNLIIFDTSILVSDLRSGKHEERIQSIPGLIRLSSVVLAELWRGASAPAEREFLVRLSRNRTLLTPSERNWLESGEILSRMHADLGFAPEKLCDLHFDVLIALTARSHGARSSRRIERILKQFRNIANLTWMCGRTACNCLASQICRRGAELRSSVVCYSSVFSERLSSGKNSMLYSAPATPKSETRQTTAVRVMHGSLRFVTPEQAQDWYFWEHTVGSNVGLPFLWPVWCG